jgi:hypothetical protein
MIMKVFALCVGLVCSIFAIGIYAYGLRQRIKELPEKSDEKS